MKAFFRSLQISRSMYLMFDFKHLFERVTVLSVIRCIIKSILLIPCAILYICCLVSSFCLAVDYLLISIPGNEIKKLYRPGEVSAESKVVRAIFFAIIHIVVALCEIIKMAIKILMSMLSLLLDIILFIVRLGDYSFAILPFTYNDEPTYLEEVSTYRYGNYILLALSYVAVLFLAAMVSSYTIDYQGEKIVSMGTLVILACDVLFVLFFTFMVKPVAEQSAEE